ncbi:hypothetical protein C5Y96_10810 [Blastopirellula marina]|uniref:Uncharacterized protein n=1 Tax=Blastopirellula marina TaxID=124 RepID=A0A2S8FNB0_9BACT|nr:hypothetical protein C5Y96_10810 [Blastopirellula marina]RCS52423.1 hypothetical protein DTL36_10820 [Bremerella cremea]
MEYFVQLTSRVTGKIQFLESDASSEEEAIGRFDSSKYDVKVIPPDQIEQARQAYYDQLQQELDALKQRAKQPLQVFLVMVGVIALLFLVMVAVLMNVNSNHSNSAPKDSEMIDTEKALSIKVLLDD